MSSPHHLHATAAAWSLRQARGALTRRAVDAARQRGEALIAAGPIRSPFYGVRRSVGGHADPVSATLTVERPPAGATTWAELISRLDGRLAWLAEQIYAADGIFPPLECITDAIPRLQPGTARLVAAHLADELAWVAALPLGWTPARHPLTGIPCPHCDQRQLVVQADGPARVWTVVCATGRPCAGADCGCGMPGAVEGVQHIWPRDVVIGAVAGATPTSPAT